MHMPNTQHHLQFHEGKDIPVKELLEHMERTFGNVHDYDTMIHSLYEVRQKDSKTMEEYMLHIHEAVAVICCTYPNRIPDQGKDLKKDHFYHGLQASLQGALSFMMTDLPEQEQVSMMFNMLYTLAKKLEAEQSSCTHRSGVGPLSPIRKNSVGIPHLLVAWQP